MKNTITFIIYILLDVQLFWCDSFSIIQHQIDNLLSSIQDEVHKALNMIAWRERVGATTRKTCIHSSRVYVLMWVIFLQSTIIPCVENVCMSNFFICALFPSFFPFQLCPNTHNPCDKFLFFEHLRNSYCGWQVDNWWMKFTQYG